MKQAKDGIKWSLWQLIALRAVFASTFSISKGVLLYVEPVFFVATRMICSGLALIAYQCFIRREKLTFKREHFWLFFQLAFFLFYLSYVLDYTVLKYISSSKWALLYTLSPLFVGIFSYFFLSERLTTKKILGLFICLIGIIPVVLKKTGQEGILGSFLGFSFSELFIITSVILYSYGWVVARKLVKYEGYSAIHVNGITMLAGGTMALITSPFIDTWSPSPIKNSYAFLSFLGLIIVINIFGYVVIWYLMRIYTATFLRLFVFIDPLWVALYGWLFLGETVTWYFFVSMAIAFMGVYVFYQEELFERYIKD